jgi:predicted nuclease with TOPRIM domain
MNDQIKHHIEEHAKEHEKLERTLNENLTMIVGQNWRNEENLRLFRAEMNEHLIRMNDRVTRLDDRVTEAHRDIAQLEISMQAVKKTLEYHDKRFDGIEKTQEEHGDMLREILSRLPEKGA